ncbi:MAG: hypothetical protein ACPF8V_10795 [Luteibaculum sp.]
MTKLASRFLVLLVLSFGVNQAYAQPIQGTDCSECGVQTCYCCDGNTGSCDCINEAIDGDNSGACGDDPSETGYGDLVCASSEAEAEQFCNNEYNPIPLNLPLALIILALLGFSLYHFQLKRSLV